MRVEFRFNGEHQLLLIPEGGKDKQLLQLMFAERPEIRMIASSDPEVTIIQASPCQKQVGDATERPKDFVRIDPFNRRPVGEHEK
jgi:hypothetical protein